MRARVFTATLVLLFILLIQQAYRAYQFVENSLVNQYAEFQTSVSSVSAKAFQDLIKETLSELANLAKDDDIVLLTEAGKNKLRNFYLATAKTYKKVGRNSSRLSIAYFRIGNELKEQRLTAEIIDARLLAPIVNPQVRKPALNTEGARVIAVAYPVFREGKPDGTVYAEVSEESLSDSFWLPILSVSGYAFTALLDSDGSILWQTRSAREEVTETYFSERDRQKLRASISRTQGRIPASYYGRLPGLKGDWLTGISPIELTSNNYWYAVCAVPDTSLKTALTTFRLINLGTALVIVLILASLLWQLMRAHKDASMMRERSELVEKFERQLEERTRELAQARDETARYAKELEMQVEARTKKLRQSEEMYRQLVQNVGTIIFMLRGSKLAFVNPAFLAVWKRKTSSRDWLGKELILLVTPKCRPDVLNALARLNDGGEIVEFSELETTEDESSVRIWEGALKRIELVDRHLIVGFFNDITDRKTLERQILQAQKLESAGRLAGGIAHDFNNILAAIFGHLTLLKEEMNKDLTPERLELINTVESAAKRAAELTKKLLVFTRPSLETVSPVDMNKALDELSTLVRTSLPKGIIFEVKKYDEELVALGEPTEVQQVLLNLCINAIEAMPEGGRLVVSAGLATSEEIPELSHEKDKKLFARVRVIDTGHGIDPRILPHIFEPFFTTKAPGKGSGLGLSIAYHIARKHNGYLTVDSDWGRGSVFTFYLPAYVSDRQRVGMPPKYQFPEFRDCPPVLIADDEELVRESVRKFFAKYNLEVITASDGVEAVNLFKERQYDIAAVVLDLRMPRMGGIEAFRIIRQLNPEVAGILVSGFGDSKEFEDYESVGFKEFLQKPYTFEELSVLFEKYVIPKKKPKPIPFFG